RIRLHLMREGTDQGLISLFLHFLLLSCLSDLLLNTRICVFAPEVERLNEFVSRQTNVDCDGYDKDDEAEPYKDHRVVLRRLTFVEQAANVDRGCPVRGLSHCSI
ncbi:hypothetical protein PMAYCL1PPCAC_29662, partial [Pristionchus mayeri]